MSGFDEKKSGEHSQALRRLRAQMAAEKAAAPKPTNTCLGALAALTRTPIGG
jgi:hypothetical protein